MGRSAENMEIDPSLSFENLDIGIVSNFALRVLIEPQGYLPRIA
jgi:hypothetical protein